MTFHTAKCFEAKTLDFLVFGRILWKPRRGSETWILWQSESLLSRLSTHLNSDPRANPCQDYTICSTGGEDGWGDHDGEDDNDADDLYLSMGHRAVVLLMKMVRMMILVVKGWKDGMGIKMIVPDPCPTIRWKSQYLPRFGGVQTIINLQCWIRKSIPVDVKVLTVS